MFVRNRKIILRLNPRFKSQSIWRKFFDWLLWLPYATGWCVFYAAQVVGEVLIAVCHGVGLSVVVLVRGVRGVGRRSVAFLEEDMSDTVRFFSYRLARVKRLEFAYSMAVLVLFIVASFGVFQVGLLLADGQILKSRILGRATSALEQLNVGKDKLIAEDPESAAALFTRAVQAFQASEQDIASANVLMRGLLAVLPAGQDAERVLKAGEYGSQTAVHLARLFGMARQMRITQTGLAGGGMNQIKLEFESARVSLQAAADELQHVSANAIPEAQRERFLLVQNSLPALREAMDSVGSALAVADALTNGRKHVLLILQNNNELRATGGFAGTFGAFDLENGVIVKQNISSIYDLDGQLTEAYVPPLPLFAVNNRWYLRDANWFADFSESAESMIGFYEQEARHTPDVVMAVTPEVAVHLLRLTGPIAMPSYGTVLDADNFVETTQVETSVYYDKEENKPKKMLADFLPILLQRIAELPPKRFPEVVAALQQSLVRRDIQLYARNEALQQRLELLGWAGRMRVTGRDYLSIVSSNLGGTKTDLAMQQNVQLSSRVDGDGTVQNTLRVHRRNPLPDVPGLSNKTFMRILVPRGSRLISSKGFSYVDLDAKYITQGIAHPKVVAWESRAVREVASGMLVGQEAGKTFFGNWIELKGGQEATVEVVYELPFKLAPVDRHSLLIQKQPGSTDQIVRYSLAIPNRRILWANDSTEIGQLVTKEMDINRDRFYGLVLEAE